MFHVHPRCTLKHREMAYCSVLSFAPLRAHEARVARHEGQQAHARVGTQRVHDDVVDIDDAVGARHDAEQARVLGQLDEDLVIPST